MSSRYWRYGAALGGLIFGVLLIAGPVAAQGVAQLVQPQSKAQGTRDPQGERYAGVSLACKPSTDGQTYSCRRERPSEPLSFGTHARRVAFRAIRDPIAILTLALFIIGGVQVELSRRNGNRQLRAYVLADNVTLTDGADITPQNGPVANLGTPRTFIVIKNTGATPAYDLIHWGAIEIKRLTEEGTLKPPPMAKAVGQKASVSVIPSQGINTKLLFMSRPPTAHEISEIETSVSGIYVYGRIEYRDAFRRKRFTNYRLRFTGSYPPKLVSQMNFCDDGNAAN